jgi:hypothetical protein
MKQKRFEVSSRFSTLVLALLCVTNFCQIALGDGGHDHGGGGDAATSFGAASDSGEAGSEDALSKASACQKQVDQGGPQAEPAKKLRDLYLAQALMSMASASANAAGQQTARSSDSSAGGQTLENSDNSQHSH